MQPLWTTVWNFIKKLKVELPFDPAILLLGIQPKNPESPIQRNLGGLMFIAAQFTIAKRWKEPKCPSANEWIKKTGGRKLSVCGPKPPPNPMIAETAPP